MHGIGQDVARIALLNNPPKIHDRNLLGNKPHNAKVMRNEEIREPVTIAELGKETDYLRLDGYVQRGHRLVADDKLGIQGDCPRY